MSRCVLDASAVLAYLHREPGFEAVNRLLEGAVMSSVNVAEVATKLVDKGAHRIDETIGELELEIIAFDESLAYRVARLRDATRGKGLSLGDRACLASAQSLGLPAVTAERSWALLDAGVEIQVIR